MTPEKFLDGRIDLWSGDSRETLALLPDNSIDSCVTDPPYSLVSILKRFGKDGSAPAKSNGATGVYRRASAGFMNARWDTGEVAFDPEFWKQVLRVLKPGGHILAMGGTRTFHHLAMAIEDAGFEIRDCVSWNFGSGFPKSHNIGKNIDRMHGAEREVRATGKPVKRMIPGADQNKAGWEKTNGRKYVPSESDPATPAAQEWEGWGTALKPAMELICLARKPLSEKTVAANVLRWGTGALNIDGCRVSTEAPRPGRSNEKSASGLSGEGGAVTYGKYAVRGSIAVDDTMQGRWPANLVHDGSPEVVAAFPNSEGGHWSGETPSLVGAQRDAGPESFDLENGSAARFFFSAKADSDDRLGSKHPTVKPVDLMQWLIRLVTPPSGVVLDPFAGTGTTGEAAWREGFRAVLIERETEYQEDIRRRMALCLSGPDERAREAIKAKLKGKPIDDGPLFGGT